MSPTAALLAAIVRLSSQQGLDPNVVTAIVAVESRFDETTVGKLGERGYMQMRPEYYDEWSLEAAITALADVKERCPHQQDNEWVVCWNAGVRGARRIADPKQNKYYKKVMREYAERKPSEIANR